MNDLRTAERIEPIAHVVSPRRDDIATATVESKIVSRHTREELRQEILTEHASEEVPQEIVSDISQKRQPYPALTSNYLRQVNREITRKIPPDEREKVLRERNALVGKKFMEGLTPREERRLAYLRWQLDRFDDADTGEALDDMALIAKFFTNFSGELKSLLSQLSKVQHQPGRTRRPQR